MSVQGSAPGSIGGPPADAAKYRRKFVRLVHRLLAEGFASLDKPSLAAKEETAITGLLIEQMRLVLEGRSCPTGAEHFSVHDDRPENADGKEGKHRGRVDVFVERTGVRPRPRFYFEAKRLNASGSPAAYVGEDGMGCFLSGKYAAKERDAGMLGYVQTDTPGQWAEKLEKKLAKEGITWEPHSLHAQLPCSYRSRHVREGQPFEIFHVLLACC